MVTVEISQPSSRRDLKEIESLVGRNFLYDKGTNRELYADFQDRLRADLIVVNLNLLPGVKARIMQDPLPGA